METEEIYSVGVDMSLPAAAALAAGELHPRPRPAAAQPGAYAPRHHLPRHQHPCMVTAVSGVFMFTFVHILYA